MSARDRRIDPQLSVVAITIVFLVVESAFRVGSKPPLKSPSAFWLADGFMTTQRCVRDRW
jgi:hypothetical protein